MASSLGPMPEMFQQDLDRQLLPDVYGGSSGKFYVEFNLRKKMQGSFEQQAAAVSASVGGPWMTRNEARSMMNLPSLDEAEDLITPLNVVAKAGWPTRVTPPRTTRPTRNPTADPPRPGTVARRQGQEVRG